MRPNPRRVKFFHLKMRRFTTITTEGQPSLKERKSMLRKRWKKYLKRNKSLFSKPPPINCPNLRRSSQIKSNQNRKKSNLKKKRNQSLSLKRNQSRNLKLFRNPHLKNPKSLQKFNISKRSK